MKYFVIFDDEKLSLFRVDTSVQNDNKVVVLKDENNTYRGFELYPIAKSLLAQIAAQRRPRGEWVWKFDENTGTLGYHCSVCGFPDTQICKHFCGKCGADMRLSLLDKAVDSEVKEDCVQTIVENGKCAICGKSLEENRVFVCRECQMKFISLWAKKSKEGEAE